MKVTYAMSDLHRAALNFQVGDFVPRRWAAALWLAPLGAPAAVARLLQYAFSVSAAVALLNAAPILCLVSSWVVPRHWRVAVLLPCRVGFSWPAA